MPLLMGSGLIGGGGGGGAGDGVGYDEVLEEGAGLTKRAKLNFIGSTVTCADNAGSTRTDCTITGAASGAPADAKYIVQTADATLTQEQSLGLLTTGLLLNTVTAGTGVLTAKAANTCTNQFPRSDNASGVWTCATIADADVPNTITVDLATLATTATTALAGDSATAFFPSGELERTLLPAASADCAASNWTKGVDADFVLDCSQPAFTDISGSVTDAQVPNTITVDLATVATTANSGDSATAFFSSGELERTLMPAASADCGAGQFAKGIDADLVLDCAADANTTDHGLLTGLTDDDHTQYLLLAGRSGGQDAEGGTAAGDDLILNSTANATKGSIFFGSEWEWADQIPDVTDNDIFYGGVWSPSYTISGPSTGVSTTGALKLNPTISFSDASAGPIINHFYMIDGRGTLALSAGTNYFNDVFFFHSEFTNTSTVSGEANGLDIVNFDSNATSKYDVSAGTGTQGSVRGFNSRNVVQNVQAGGTYTVSALTGIQVQDTVTETAGTMNVTLARGVYARNLAISGTPQVTTQIGVDIEQPTRATAASGNIGLRNAGTTVYTNTNQAVTAVTDTITCSATYQTITLPSGSMSLTSNPSIADGATGQICIIQNVGANILTLTDATKGMNLGAATRALSSDDTLTLIYGGAAGDWIEMDWSDN
jgi:hypothetical protein